jgi:condensin complex subunit 3
MPGRVSIRASRASSGKTVSTKSSTATLKTRSTRSSALAVDIPDEGESTSLREQICSVFSDAQRSTATQRKLVVSLRKIQEACCYEPVKARKKNKQVFVEDEDFGEGDFNDEFARCLLRVLPIKKSEPVGDRTIRFVGLFLKLASEKGLFCCASAGGGSWLIESQIT